MKRIYTLTLSLILCIVLLTSCSAVSFEDPHNGTLTIEKCQCQYKKLTGGNLEPIYVYISMEKSTATLMLEGSAYYKQCVYITAGEGKTEMKLQNIGEVTPSKSQDTKKLAFIFYYPVDTSFDKNQVADYFSKKDLTLCWPGKNAGDIIKVKLPTVETV